MTLSFIAPRYPEAGRSYLHRRDERRIRWNRREIYTASWRVRTARAAASPDTITQLARQSRAAAAPDGDYKRGSLVYYNLGGSNNKNTRMC
jgi:hypothetical protein